MFLNSAFPKSRNIFLDFENVIDEDIHWEKNNFPIYYKELGKVQSSDALNVATKR